MIPQAIAEAISSVINQEEEPHEALGKLLRTWQKVSHADAVPPPPLSGEQQQQQQQKKKEEEKKEEEGCAHSNGAEASLHCASEGSEDDWQHLWAHEVTLLEAIGFECFGDVLPLLLRFLGTPLSIAITSQDSNLPEPAIDPEGFQKVVNNLIALRARDREAAEQHYAQQTTTAATTAAAAAAAAAAAEG